MTNETKTTWNVKVTYRLSAQGQRAALLAGRSATAEVTETMTTLDPAMLDQVNILPDGSLSLDARDTPFLNWADDRRIALDEPPASLAEVVGMFTAAKRAAAEKHNAIEAEKQAQEAEKQAQEAARRAADYPVVEARLAILEALADDAPLPGPITISPSFGFGTNLSHTREQLERITVVFDRRRAAEVARRTAEEAARRATSEALIAEKGGMWWAAEGGMCDFRHYRLWLAGQDRRWVGVFTAVKGIARFLDSPRGEHTFSITSLVAGDCIQGGGYAQNSRGKRRSESEFFGVVIRNDADGLVIAGCPSRTAAFKHAARSGSSGL